MKKLIAALLLSAGVAAPAFAESPFYVGAELGDGYIGALGGYQINKTFSVEAHYYDIDRKDIPYGHVDASAFGIAGVATFPITLKGAPPFSLFASVGVDRTKVKQRTDVFGTTTSSSDTETDVVVSGGAQYDFNKNWSARAGLHLNGYDDSLFLNAIYRF